MKFIFILAFIVLSCEQTIHKDEMCSIQGFTDLQLKRITCDAPLSLSEVEFSNGSAYTMIQGIVNLNTKNYSFTILSNSTEVVEHKFPLADIDSLQYKCTISYPTNKSIEIVWKREGKRLFLKKRLP